jgi:Ser/Thr protein kinase RdoA (MazF antagonist)
LVKGDGLMGLRGGTVDRLAALFGGPVLVVDTLVDHDERCVLDLVLPDGRPAVAKCVVDPGRADAEARVLEAASAAGAPVPRLIGRVVGPPAVLVMERVGGDWLSPDRPAGAWAAAGVAVRRLHGVRVAGLSGFAGRDGWAAGLRELTDFWGPRACATGLDGRVVDAVSAAAERLLRSRPGEPPFVTLHGDCVPIHVRLEDDEVVGLLDLGDACRGDPAWDLAVLTMRSPERLPAVLDGYGANTELRAWAAPASPVYRALRLVAEVGWLADHDFDPAEAMREATSAAETTP